VIIEPRPTRAGAVIIEPRPTRPDPHIEPRPGPTAWNCTKPGDLSVYCSRGDVPMRVCQVAIGRDTGRVETNRTRAGGG
jgi:hypothetical protein